MNPVYTATRGTVFTDTSDPHIPFMAILDLANSVLVAQVQKTSAGATLMLGQQYMGSSDAEGDQQIINMVKEVTKDGTSVMVMGNTMVTYMAAVAAANPTALVYALNVGVVDPEQGFRIVIQQSDPATFEDTILHLQDNNVLMLAMQKAPVF